MIYNHFVDFLMWLAGCLHIVAIIGGLAFFVFLMAYGLHGKYDGRFLWWLDDLYHGHDDDDDDNFKGKRMAK